MTSSSLQTSEWQLRGILDRSRRRGGARPGAGRPARKSDYAEPLCQAAGTAMAKLLRARYFVADVAVFPGVGHPMSEGGSTGALPQLAHCTGSQGRDATPLALPLHRVGRPPELRRSSRSRRIDGAAQRHLSVAHFYVHSQQRTHTEQWFRHRPGHDHRFYIPQKHRNRSQAASAEKA